MTALGWMLCLLAAVALLTTVQLIRVLGWRRGVLFVLPALLALGGYWAWLASAATRDARREDWAAVASCSSESCAKCHQDHYDSWHRTYHRTMTREATPENVRGDFANAVYDYQGLRTRMMQRGDGYYMETVDPNWALLRARAKEGDPQPPRYTLFRVKRLVGSHWVQECLSEDPNGRFNRLPVLYHIAERRWVHTNGAFLAPDTNDFWDKCRATTWNDSCLYCHNTGPSKNPMRGPRGQVMGYRTQTAELGISCEACHGPGGDHITLNHNPARRLSLQQSDEADSSIVHPARLPVPRRDEVCARCHGALVPKPDAWDSLTHRDPFVPGQELSRFNTFFWSEVEQAALAGRHDLVAERGAHGSLDGRFWGDGTPLTTALEYNGMALSLCYQNGKGQMSCLSCHAMHAYEEPNYLLKPGTQTNRACYGCHAEYEGRLTEHTRHAADSPASLCYNCHMPHQVYSLLTTHRSHRIQVPKLEDSLDTGKPHACNLCHLDKSLGWTQEQLGHWPGRRAALSRALSREEKEISAAVLALTRGDARTRALVAGAFSNPAAQQVSGTDWFGPFLVRLIEQERYPVVRYLAHRGLRSVHGDSAVPFDYLGTPAVRGAQLRTLRSTFDHRPVRRLRPYLPLTPDGLPDDAVLHRLLDGRSDPDVIINE